MLRKGIPFIYQGQEIGLENQVFHGIDAFDDISTLNEYEVALKRGSVQTRPWLRWPESVVTMPVPPCSGPMRPT